MLDTPKVSVIITTYNRAGLLPRAVNSVLAQTYDDYEVIIVDDCSTDDTQQVVAKFADSRIRHFRHEVNRGASGARNTGIANARGEYIAFLDDDDECAPNRLADQASKLDCNPDVGMVYGWIEEVNDELGISRVPKNIQNTHRGRDSFDAALTGMTFTAAMPYPIIRSSVVRQVGGYDERAPTNGEDTIFCAAVAQICDVEYVPKIIARVHFNHAYDRLSQTETPEKFDLFLEAHTQKFGDELSRRPKVRAEFYMGTAAGLMRVKQPRRAIGYMIRALTLHPLSVSNFSRLIYVGRAFVWYATPLRRIRQRARNIRSLIFLTAGAKRRKE